MNFKPMVLILVIIFSVGNSSISMEDETRKLINFRVPFELINYSSEMVTVLFPKGDGTAYYSQVGTNEIKNASDSTVNPQFFYLKGIFGAAQVNTIKGLFQVRVLEDNTIVLEKCSGDYSHQLVQKFNNALCVIKTSVAVDSQGMPQLSILPVKPSDGRPDVALHVYGKLVGDESYATAKQILGIQDSKDVKTAYENKMLQWHPDRNKSPEAVAAFALINWAAEKLGVR
ncbi:hypothetical protein BH09DEP1_BH09DEP1_1220 [soil metagenome]